MANRTKRSTNVKIVVAGLLLAAAPAFAKPRPRTASHASLKHGSAKLHKSVRSSSKFHDASGMNAERATEIQTALIQRGYLSGEPSGVWDSQSSAAMSKLQADNGWQSKITPDARGLIKLGLGPDSIAAATPTR